MNIMVFDIETIPDCRAGKLLYGFDKLSDADIAEGMLTLRRQETDGSDFLRHYCHQIVAISIVLRRADELRIWSLGEIDSDEKELLLRFYHGIDKYTPTLVSWNGCGFDLPVIHYRSLIHGVSAARYWETGEMDQSFKWNNYLNRYHDRHLDLMDVLSAFQGRATAPLTDIASLLGFPGKIGMSGANVWQNYQNGKLKDIRNYCETDVLNTYLIYLRFEMIRGNLSEAHYQEECQLIRDYLKESDETHWKTFNEKWLGKGGYQST